MSSSAALEKDARLTAERDERKYLVPRTHIRRLAEALDQRLASHRFRGDGANALPGARHFVTTIYFDTQARDLFRRASSAVNVKLRAKEYYDLHPALVEVATDPRQIVRYQPILWLEVKERQHQRTSKRRVGILKADVPAFLARGQISDATLRVQEQAYGAAGVRVLSEVAAICSSLAAPLEPACLVNYRRRAWQDADDLLRVTLDLQLAFFAAPAELFTRATPLVREALGPPAADEPLAVVEVKGDAGVPAWLEQLLDGLGATCTPYSKFESASRSVHG